LEPTKKYKNPPLLEVICEFVFPNDGGIDFEKIDSSFTDRVKNEFPIRRERKDKSYIIEKTDNDLDPKISRMPTLIQYVDSKENLMAQIGNNLLAVNHLKPYNSWEDFSPIVLKNLNIYKECSNKLFIERVTFRYINKIEIPVEELKISDYFNYAITIPTGISNTIGNLMIQTENIYEENEILGVTLHTIPSQTKEKASFIFDISYTSANHNNIDFSKIHIWLNKAHKILNDVFEKSLSEKCKKLFEL
jgi:uncharacterized protein (TIGR04255 family)